MLTIWCVSVSFVGYSNWLDLYNKFYTSLRFAKINIVQKMKLGKSYHLYHVNIAYAIQKWHKYFRQFSYLPYKSNAN